MMACKVLWRGGGGGGVINCHLVYSQLVYYPFHDLIAQARFSGLGLELGGSGASKLPLGLQPVDLLPISSNSTTNI